MESAVTVSKSAPVVTTPNTLDRDGWKSYLTIPTLVKYMNMGVEEVRVMKT